MGKTTNERGAIQGFELGKFAAVHDSGNDFTYVKGFARVRWDNSVNLIDCIVRFNCFPGIQADVLTGIEVGNGPPRQLQGMLIVQSVVVRHARLA